MLKNKRKREGVSRKIKTLLNKSYKLGKIPGVDIALVICNHGRYLAYKSIDRESFPPTMAEIKMSYPLPKIFLPSDFEKDAYQSMNREVHGAENCNI
ncbi:hypothetical protein BGZ60DRAFT_372933 [Tricladium varicosporioides]|nr:hypothetical protein BGZ60DRAFT_372933 [Hymenoscyphus varicosporioides]